MAIHAEAVSPVGWYQDDAYMLWGKVVTGENLIIFFILP